MTRDKIFGEKDPVKHMAYGIIGLTLGVGLVVAMIFFTSIGKDIPLFGKVFVGAVSYAGGILWLYSNRPNRKPGSRF